MNISSENWTPEIKDSFSATIGAAIDAWEDMVEAANQALFSGDEDSIDKLTTLISNGNFFNIQTKKPESFSKDMEAMVVRTFFSFAITRVWQDSGIYPFVLDSGSDCGKADLDAIKIDSQVASTTGYCYKGRQYYLVYPNGDPKDCQALAENCPSCNYCNGNTFSAPTGVDDIDADEYDGISIATIIEG